MGQGQAFSLKFLNSRDIKIAAIILMTVDHIGKIMYPDTEIYRIIGRVAFPLFAFLIAFGCTKTRNIGKYFVRLIAFGCFTQALFFMLNIDIINIFFTLAIGVLAIWIVQSIWRKMMTSTHVQITAQEPAPRPRVVMFVDRAIAIWFLGAVALAVAYFGELIRVDYGLTGVMLIVGFWAACLTRGWWQFAIVTATLTAFNLLFYPYDIQWWSMVALPFILLFTPQKIKTHPIEKYAFYLYYPLHIVIIFLI